MEKEQFTNVANIATIQTKIYEFRGEKVMIDKDLALLYGVETKVLNQAVKRNIERFPEDFMFQLTKEECLRSQFVTLNMEQGKHLKYFPFAFTELGIAMLSGILHSPIAIQRDQNDTNDLMQGQLDALTDSMTELSVKVDSLTTTKKTRKPVGFVIPKKEK